MNFKRYHESDNSWTDSHYIKKTDTDIITSLPATIYPLAQTATVGLKGNTVQNGTHSPTSPIMPEGCGDKTANLFDKDSMIKPWYISTNGNIAESTGGSYSIIVPCQSNKMYCCSYPTEPDAHLIRWGSIDHYPVIGDIVDNYSYPQYGGTSSTYTTSSNAQYLMVFLYNVASPPDISPDDFFNQVMLNEGSTPQPHEPYGYKIPISSNSTTTPIYLGEVETTRRVKKLVLDGTEDWTISSAWKKTNTSVFYFPVSDIGGTSDNERYILSTHFASKSRAELYRDDIEGIGKTGNNAVTVRVDDTIATTVNDFKAWLRDNNITVWYVLATEETGIVNEPLMKIGNYADSISGISIPTIAGANTLDVQTTVKPSEVTASFNGWHPVTSAHERESGAWT